MSDSYYRICTRCIMDTTDPEIQFNENGVCNHCRDYEIEAQRFLLPETERKQALDRLVATIKERGKGKEYDCIIGVSGGVDSTYLAYLVKKLGLRPLAVHMDNGWNSELAVSNIEKVLKALKIDLYTHVLDWEEFKDLQLSFLKASVPDAEIPTDHAIFGVIYRVAVEKGISYYVIGTNVVTEGILPGRWTYGVTDWIYIKSIHKKFGQRKLRTYPHFSRIAQTYLKSIKKIKVVSILDYIPYVKNDVINILERELGWKYYGGKHYESIYTRFFQGYILPRKFNIDKRRAHLSTLVCSGQMTREEALEEMKHNNYTEHQMREDYEYVIKKLGLTKDEFEKIMSLPIKTFSEYTTLINHPVYKFLRTIKSGFLLYVLRQSVRQRGRSDMPGSI